LLIGDFLALMEYDNKPVVGDLKPLATLFPGWSRLDIEKNCTLENIPDILEFYRPKWTSHLSVGKI